MQNGMRYLKKKKQWHFTHGKTCISGKVQSLHYLDGWWVVVVFCEKNAASVVIFYLVRTYRQLEYYFYWIHIAVYRSVLSIPLFISFFTYKWSTRASLHVIVLRVWSYHKYSHCTALRNCKPWYCINVNAIVYRQRNVTFFIDHYCLYVYCFSINLYGLEGCQKKWTQKVLVR